MEQHHRKQKEGCIEIVCRLQHTEKEGIHVSREEKKLMTPQACNVTTLFQWSFCNRKEISPPTPPPILVTMECHGKEFFKSVFHFFLGFHISRAHTFWTSSLDLGEKKYLESIPASYPYGNWITLASFPHFITVFGTFSIFTMTQWCCASHQPSNWL